MASVVQEFIPEIMSAQILAQKDKVHILGNLANRNYEGEIKAAGQTVRIPQVGDVTVNTYTRNNFGTGLTLEQPNVASLTLDITQEKYFNVGVDIIDISQSKVDFWAKIAGKAAYAIADVQDQFIAGLYSQCGLVSTSNSASTYITLGSSNVRSQFLLQHKKFDQANIQRQGRWATICPALMFELVDAGVLEQSNNDVVWTNGIVGNAYGWNLYVTNNLSSPSTDTDQYRLLFGVGNESITFAEQLVRVTMGDLTQSQKGFGEFIAGLHVYGARFIPDRSGVMYAKVTND